MPRTTQLLAWRRAGLFLVLLIVLGAPLWHLHVIDGRMPFRHNDLIGRWVGTKAALQGQNPYSGEVLSAMQDAYYGRPLTPADHLDAQAFLYPATIVVPLAPLTLLSWQACSFVFLVVTASLLLLSFYLCLQSLPISLSRNGRNLAILLAFFSWPTVWGLRLLQPTLPLVALILIAGFLLSRKHQIFPAFLLAFATIKPQIALPLILWLLIWAGLQRFWKFIATFGLALGMLLWTTHLIVPGWLAQWRGSLRNYSAVTMAVPPLEWAVGQWIGLALTAVIAALTCIPLARLLRAPARSLEFALAQGLVLSLTLCFVPTHLAMVYNQIILLPGIVLLISAFPGRHCPLLARRVTIALCALSYLAPIVAVAGESVFGPSNFWDKVPFRLFLLPVAVTVALALQATEVLSYRAVLKSGVAASSEPIAAV